MSIHYSLVKNDLVDEPNVYRAKTSQISAVSQDDVVKFITNMGSTLTEIDIRGVLEGFNKVVQDLLGQGISINLPFANFSSSIRGKFIGSTDSYDKSRHTVRAMVNPGRDLKLFYKNGIQVEKIRAGTLGPELLNYIDKVTGSINSYITPGGLGVVQGYMLKFDPDDKEQGIFFVENKSGDETKVKTIGLNKPKSVIFTVPEALKKGKYSLKIKVRFGDNLKTSLLKNITLVT